MSVPVNERSHGKLEAYTKAYELAVYTIKITSNKKVFTEEYQNAVTDKIISCATDIYLLTGSANDIAVKTQDDIENFHQRIGLQKTALQKCGELSKLIVLSKPLFHLSSKRVKYWAGLVRDARTLIKAWSDSDIKRFKPLF